MSTTTLVKWGNGQGVRLSKETMERAGLQVGDSLEVNAENGMITLIPAKRRYVDIPDYRQLFKGYNGPAPVEDGFASSVGQETN
ncbi:AbrB/MazE/SpoVT family DNA-binding domain-containing protein [Bifidobacterium scaligerum]|uniref:AbrB/MazE/SpoVT family DNA-binding domain-containing protein n=1 Tax=Bifidobacterium scaligerum TaxID=2052656 RepID=A0A2M9HN59_9BIFI|nr:AbrB/MazE/SpoVT family DNA-binding domain-containing protein [Bifidobacterium scaligerum]PJM78219.1 AbrB/MazE/SpoVT family DNA-binding domain-containing protein [Bifidobacterium scaligerum]